MIELPGAFQGSPAIAANRMVIASDKGTVYCFGQKTLQANIKLFQVLRPAEVECNSIHNQY